MSTKRICDGCGIYLGNSGVWLTDMSFSLPGLDFCLDCFSERERLAKQAYNKLPLSIEKKAPPLGYWVYYEDTKYIKPGLPMEVKVDEMYKITPTLEEVYH